MREVTVTELQREMFVEEASEKLFQSKLKACLERLEDMDELLESMLKPRSERLWAQGDAKP